MYLFVLTIPDIAFASRFLKKYYNCLMRHTENIYKVLKYLNKTENFGFQYVKTRSNFMGYTGFIFIYIKVEPNTSMFFSLMKVSGT